MKSFLVCLSLTVLVWPVELVLAQSRPDPPGSRQPVRLTTPRISPLPESQWTDRHRALVREYAPDGRVGNALSTLLHVPELAEAIMPFVEFLAQVRGVDDETRIAPRGAVADPVVIEQDDARIGRQLRQAAGGGEAGDAGADHHPVGVLLALEAIRRRRGRQHRVPPGGLIHVRKQGVVARHGSGCRSSRVPVLLIRQGECRKGRQPLPLMNLDLGMVFAGSIRSGGDGGM